MLRGMKLETSLWHAIGSRPLAWRAHAPLLFAALCVIAWAALAAGVNTGQFSDSIEQYNWAHGLELGYWKHPPLPTWLMAAAIALLGAGPATSYVLATACFVGTAVFTWKIAQRLLPQQPALPAIAVILLTLHQGFSWRAQLYNHNTVLVLAVSAMVWATLCAVQSGRRVHWLGAGALAGAALMSKYQAAVPILGVLFALWRSGVLRERRQRGGVALALLAALIVVLPHVVWSVQHQLPTYRYFKESAPLLDGPSRLSRWMAFMAVQLRFHLPMLGALGTAALFTRVAHVAGPADTPAPAAPVPLPLGPWLWGLVGLPFLTLMGIVLLLGIKLQSHWGLQTLQFLPLLLAAMLRHPPLRIRVRPLLAAALAIHLGGAYLYVRTLEAPEAGRSMSSVDRVFPASELAGQAVADWHAATHCPLRYVAGPGFEAGLISVYSGAYPAVLEDGDYRKSPWIDPAELARHGALVISKRPDALGDAGDDEPQSIVVPGRRRDRAQPQRVFWRVQPPRESCH